MSRARRSRGGDWRKNQYPGVVRSRDSRTRRLAYEPLEDRRMLSGYFDEIRDLVAAPGAGGAMGAITQGLSTVNSLAKLPLINKPLQQIGEVTAALESFRDDLYNAVQFVGSI